MHVYFSGIGGTGIGPLALIAKQAGYDVSGSDLRESAYIHYLSKQGITDVNIGQTREQIAASHARRPIDWLVYSSALPKTNPNHPELVFCEQNSIKTSKRDDFINEVLDKKHLKLIAVAGTHGKTTTTAMTIWLLKQLGIPVSYSVGAKISFGGMGEFDPKSQFFVYECDEFDRNFLSFHPHTALITGIDWDHPDIYPSRQEYYQAFHNFLNQCEKAMIWRSDLDELGLPPSHKLLALDDKDPDINDQLHLTGLVNRQDAWLVAQAASKFMGLPLDKVIAILNKFPGLSRRFEEIVPNLYTDYAHTPPKTRGALQTAREVAGDNVVVVYEGLHNTRQHFIKDELASLFDDVKQLYIVPSYLAREDESLKLLSPTDLLHMLSIKSKDHAEATQLDDNLKRLIQKHISAGDLVLCLSAGGVSSLDEWLRKEFS
jgi:UDP-N-acetylmuramate--alanine ligase